MDIGSLIGILGALGLIGAAMASGGDMGAFVDVASIQIVVGGTACAVMYAVPMPYFVGSFGVFGKAFMPVQFDHKGLVERAGELAALARKDGMMALEGQETPDRFFEKGLQMLVDGADEAKIVTGLEIEIEQMKVRHANNQGVWDAWIDLAPAMGMIGTLVGLVQMLGNMSDPKSIGPAMAVALLTTMYGAMVANVLCMPLVSKLKMYSALEVQYRTMVITVLRGLSRGESPRNIQDELQCQFDGKTQASMADG